MRTTGPDSANDSHEEVALLPWYVNGSLSGEEYAKVREHAGRCEYCQEQIALLRTLAAQAKRAPLASTASADDAFARFARSRGLPGAARRGAPPARWGWLTRRGLRTLPGLAAAAAILLLAGSPAMREVDRYTAPNFRTLGIPAGAGLARQGGDLRLIFEAGTPQARIDVLLDAVGASILAGPDAGGLYVVGLGRKAGAGMNRESAMAWLREREEVAFVEPAVEP